MANNICQVTLHGHSICHLAITSATHLLQKLNACGSTSSTNIGNNICHGNNISQQQYIGNNISLQIENNNLAITSAKIGNNICPRL